MNIKEMLAEKGANQAQLESKTVRMMENIIAETTDDELKRVGAEIADKRKTDLAFAIREASRLEASLDRKKREVEAAAYKIENAVKPSDENAQAIWVYKRTLEATSEVFGKDIDAEVMVAAITAASYGMWRSIMGESKPLIEYNGKPRRI